MSIDEITEKLQQNGNPARLVPAIVMYWTSIGYEVDLLTGEMTKRNGLQIKCKMPTQAPDSMIYG